ncbi:7-carboxy-7-deazaguanine synthase QueE [Deinococcus soli (ex Cha et al. 2016)]|uniref:Organic radical activating enzyme n=2 Tax=Deinococcus soli (ex Cha et al. 2016) TaxID=1309411 RepID=A0ACC6KK03_9DEIO|nr:7-carboxy-7-deazaguanine synthase QueE [Deinococcus soli (ex Cha et al. 2016)]MDR6219835.1 organic radical activating enzyme [Deinococcus soli (ex Cha et al. 2016)]MDR6329907.1 organic radical activating enzyme [Deinococcus soli (ex Cha et al. 2016)]MDR6752742.1 organic radical activating enzyme [Deinococcus soli (ex Cha et al. 2016)]
MKYPVYERFYTWQGEGVHLGRAAYFIRLYGCPQACPWCDSAGTWHRDYRPDGVTLMGADELAEVVRAESPDGAVVVITGGEPILFDLAPLTDALHALGRRVHIETSGIAPLRGELDWVTLSPKPFGQPPLPEVVAVADEVKIIVHEPGDIQAGLDTLTGLREDAVIWLHPEWSKARERDLSVLNAITQAVKENPRLRAGYQMHKLYRADDLDAHSDKRLIPLGGNAALGY